MMGKEGEAQEGEVRALSPPGEEGISEEAAGRKRSTRPMRMEELKGASEMDRMLKLKREIDELENLETERMQAHARRQAAVFVQSYIEPAVEKRKEKKKTKVVTREVPLELIEYYILNPHNPMPDYSELRLDESPQTFRELMAVMKAIADKMLEYQKSIIKQFRTNGKAYDYQEVEVDDEDDEEEKKDDDDEEN